ncbi:MAG TPA: GRAM domain-containing protein, partial [Dyadobacter sp.]|nr:GRAM domain-containing protein [Dyadobacter sp.]
RLFTAEKLDSRTVMIAISGTLISFVFIGGLVYLASRFTKTKSPQEQGPKIELDNDEFLILQSIGTHLKGIDAVGGKLVLTNKRLIFKSQKLNIQPHKLSIPLTDITSVCRTKTLGLVNNGLAITTTDGIVENFTVEAPSEWIEKLAPPVPSGV